MTPILSIVIPTKNRVAFVNALTADLVRAEGYDPSAISITVLDNATPGADYQLPREVTLCRREVAVSAIENILSAAALSHGTYSWIMGDDDAFAADIFARVFRLIRQFEPGIIKLDYQYVETDAVIPAFAVPPGPAPSQQQQSTEHSIEQSTEDFCWHGFGLAAIAAFEHKAGFISAHIFRTDLLGESLRLMRSCIAVPLCSQNVYLTKLYAAFALLLSGGYWVSRDVLVKQRVPLTGRNFVETGEAWFVNFVAAPAEVYRACLSVHRSYAQTLLGIHFAKGIDYGTLTRERVSISKPWAYIVQNAWCMGLPRAGKELLRCAKAYWRASLTA